MKRILALDGGGIRGVFSLEVLFRMEALLREHLQSPKMVLADYFDFFAGTSTGAIIATCLCWGMTVEEVLNLYVKFGKTMFTQYPWYRPFKKFLVSKYDSRPLSDFLQKLFSEDGTPALLDTPRLKKLLLVVMRNLTTGSAWPISNNPEAIYNHSSRADSNLKIPLYQLVRASTAAPVYFDPEKIRLGEFDHHFVDGSITPYNNPALIAALMAVLPCYNLKWETGPEKIRVVSVGTLSFSSALSKRAEDLWLKDNAAKIPAALIQGVAWEQDLLCRCIGKCIYGDQLDSEVGNLTNCELPGREWFSYVRYNKTYKAVALEEVLRKSPDLARLDAVHAIPMLREVGQAYATEHVRLEHLT